MKIETTIGLGKTCYNLAIVYVDNFRAVKLVHEIKMGRHQCFLSLAPVLKSPQDYLIRHAI